MFRVLAGFRSTSLTGLITFSPAIFDELVKSQKVGFPVIPAKAGIQLFQTLKNSLDSGFHRSDDFLRFHHLCRPILRELIQNRNFLSREIWSGVLVEA